MERDMICQVKPTQEQELFVPSSAAGSHCTLKPQEVIWTNVTSETSDIKLEITEETDEADPLLLEGRDQVVSVERESICQAEEQDCHDPKLFVGCCKSEPQDVIKTDVSNVRPTMRCKLLGCTSICDNAELIIPGTLEGCDEETYCSNHNSSQSHHGCIDSEKCGTECRELYLNETTAATGSGSTIQEPIQGIDCWVTPLGVEDVAEQGGEVFREDTQHENPAGFLRAEKSFQCGLCKELFSLKTTLKIHIIAHTLNKPYQCQVCKKQFSRSSNLAMHSRIHSGLKPYQCQVCNKEFSCCSYLTRHSRIHSSLKPYQCQVCKKQFSRSSYLSTHSRVHSGSKPYGCQVCNKWFSDSSGLTKHSRSHSGLKPYECQVCHKEFSRSSSLTIHSSIHSGLKPYQCRVCNKQFSCSSSLIRHSRMHTGLKPYNCQVCKKQFSDPSHFAAHSRIHSGLKPYQCEVCQKQFSDPSALAKHSRLHSGLKPYECDVCHKKFSDSSNLTRHSRIHKVLKL